MKLRAKSPGRTKMAPRKRIVKIGAFIASLAVGSFGGAQFSTFLDGNSLQDDGTEAKPIFGCISLSEKNVFAKKEKKSSSSPSSWLS